MNFKLTMTLVIVVLALAIMTMIAKNNSKPVEAKAGTTTPLLEKKPESIKTITYKRDNVTQVKFEKDGENWNMVEPVKAPVDTYTVGNIASSLQNLNYVRKFEPEPTGDRSAEATGTAKTRNTIMFTDNAGKEYTLAIGYKTNEGGVFALFNGGKTIYAMEGNPITQLAKDPDDFRKKQIKQIEESKIVKLEVKSSKVVDGKVVASDIKLEKTDGKWQITEPVAARANVPVVQEIVKAVSNVNALSFSSLKKNEAGVDPGVASVTAWVEEPVAATASAPATATAPASASAPATTTSKPATKLTEVTLKLGLATSALNRDSSPVYAGMADRDDVFTLSRDTFTNVSKELKDLRDPAVLPATIRKATEFTLTTDDKVTATASNKDGAWKVGNGSTQLTGDGTAIGDYLGAVEDLRAIKFVDAAGDLKSLGLDPPHMKIDLTIPGQTQHEVLLVGKSETGVEGGKVTPVMRQGEKTVYQVQTTDAAKLATTPVALRDRSVDRLDADRIRKIEISGPLATAGAAASQPATGPATASAPATSPAALKPGVVLEREGTHWVVKKDGESKAADDSKISALLADFTPVTASKYVDDKALAEGTPNVVVTLTLLAPTETPATATAPAAVTAATATAPATAPAAPIVAPTGAMGPEVGKTVTYTLRLYHQEAAATASAPATAPASAPAGTWKAVWDKQTPTWTFEPTAALINHVAKDVYTTSPNAGIGPAPMPLPEEQ